MENWFSWIFYSEAVWNSTVSNSITSPVGIIFNQEKALYLFPSVSDSVCIESLYNLNIIWKVAIFLR